MPDRLFALLLRLYPRAFRERYAGEMTRVFRERLRDEPAIRVWFDVLRDAAVSIPRQHLQPTHPMPHPIYPPSAVPMMRTITTRVFLSMLVSGLLVFIVGFFGGVAILDPAVAVFISTRLPGGWAVPVVLFAIWLLVFRHWWRLNCLIKSTRAEVDSDSIMITGADRAPLTLERSDVVGLHEFPRLGLRIETADPDRDLWVPVAIPSYASVRAAVSDWAPLRVTAFPYFPPRPPLTSVTLFVLTYAFVLFLPAPFGAGFALALFIGLVRALIGRTLTPIKAVLALGPFAILLARYFW